MEQTGGNKNNNKIIDLSSAGAAKKKTGTVPVGPLRDPAGTGSAPIRLSEKQILLKRLQEAKVLYSLLSICTKCPYVSCDEESFDDGVEVFFDEERAKEAAKRLIDEKIPVGVVRIDEGQKLSFFSALFTMGVNALFVYDAEDGREIVQLEEFVKRRLPEDTPQSQWVENPALLLTALYYAQETRRGPVPDEDGHIREMQEEMLADFRRGKYIFAVEKESKNTPLLKIGEELFHPVFTDVLEFKKFNRDGNFLPAVVEAERLPKQLADNAHGVVINPVSLNLVLNLKRPAQPVQKAAAPSPQEQQTAQIMREIQAQAAKAAQSAQAAQPAPAAQENNGSADA